MDGRVQSAEQDRSPSTSCDNGISGQTSVASGSKVLALLIFVQGLERTLSDLMSPLPCFTHFLGKSPWLRIPLSSGTVKKQKVDLTPGIRAPSRTLSLAAFCITRTGEPDPGMVTHSPSTIAVSHCPSLISLALTAVMSELNNADVRGPRARPSCATVALP